MIRRSPRSFRAPSWASIGIGAAAISLGGAGDQALAASEIRRVGLFVGSNAGGTGREPLLHAEADAIRIRRVFLELGGMKEEDAILLESPEAEDMIDRIHALADRAPRSSGLLFVFFYSGHADDRALLLGSSELSIADLRRALEGVSAELHLHLIDACRSGAVTRPKGARIGPPIAMQAAPLTEGRVVITSSAEWEDSQESDRLGGSFFTHHLASGLRGAADADRDGAITLAEAYAYVYGRTLESTLATTLGPQHPTFRYDMHGRGEVVLTWAGFATSEAGILELSGGGDYLVVDEGSGRVVVEVRARPMGERLALTPGSYRISKRLKDALLEGSIVVPQALSVAADGALTERIAYARWVRKGDGSARASHAVWLEGGVRGPLGRSIGARPMVRAGYELSLPWFSLRPRFGFVAPAEIVTPRLSFSMREVDLGIEAIRAHDLDILTVGAGLAADIAWLGQRERSERETPRNALGVVVGAVAMIESRPLFGWSGRVVGEVSAYSFPVSDVTREPAGSGEIDTVLTYRALLSVGYGF